jgi:hypothetical protein
VRASEALRELAALQVRAQLALDVTRKATLAVLARVGKERFEVGPDELIQHGFRWAARRVRGRERGHSVRATARGVLEVGRAVSRRYVVLMSGAGSFG